MSQKPEEQELTKEELDEYKTYDIAELRKLLKDSNQKRTFKKSKQIDRILKSKTTMNYDDAVSSGKKQLDSKFAQIFSVHNDQISQIEEDFKKNELNLRRSINDSFQEMKDRQLQSWIKVEAQKSSELKREKARSNSTIKSLQKIAVSYADQGEYEKAIMADNEAQALQQEEALLQTRQTEIAYSKRFSQLQAQFGLEIDVLESRLNKGFEGINQQKLDEIRKCQNNTSAAIQRAVISIINSTKSKVPKVETQADIATSLTMYAKKKATENGMNRQFQFD